MRHRAARIGQKCFELVEPFAKVGHGRFSRPANNSLKYSRISPTVGRINPIEMLRHQ